MKSTLSGAVQGALLSVGCALILLGHEAATAASEPGFADRLEVQNMLRQQNYGALETLFANLEARYERGAEDDRALGHAYLAFASTAPEFEELLSGWVDHSPDSYRPYLARGIHYEHLGWTRRGARNRRNTASERFDAMRAAMDKALTDLERARELRPDMPVTHAEIVRIAKAFVPAQELRRLADRGLTHDPASFTIRFATAYGLRPRWGGSLEALRGFINETEKHIRDNTALAGIRGFLESVEGDRLDRKGQFDKAIQAYDKAIRFGALHFFFRERGEIHRSAGKYGLAVSDFTQALALWPQDADTLTERADAHRDEGRLKEARADYERALALDPVNPDATQGRTRVLLKQGEVDKALETAKRPLEANIQDPDNWYLAGWILLNSLDRPQDAARHLQRATELAPRKTYYRFALIRAQHKTRDCGIVSQLKRYLEACESGDSCPEARTNWARKTYEQFQNRGICAQ